MYLDFTDYCFYVRPGKTDMRKRSSSLSMIVQNQMKLKPFEKAVFFFCSANHTILRAIVWEKNGFIETLKRLESGTYCWPKTEEEALKVRRDDILNMLYCQNPGRKREELHYKKAY